MFQLKGSISSSIDGVSGSGLMKNSGTKDMSGVVAGGV